ncbi:unnamed protein product [Acanthoscelides obtectus]|uniref:Uncharacterized protein n=1 Tax=Acanthoscelides obtectus TaxID=200917 RepID=A0A9P0M7M0_ACAOB|nr:unnamed protein product [Acanthoscelides obtectus]CAK1642134.1 hypothetical protein AOBTE_LOCUS12844 [Acanthoscelides obtectus]
MDFAEQCDRRIHPQAKASRITRIFFISTYKIMKYNRIKYKESMYTTPYESPVRPLPKY